MTIRTNKPTTPAALKRFASATLTATVLLLAGAVSAAPTINGPAPEFTAVDSNGVSHSLSDFRGSAVVLEWTNHDCPFVVKHYQGNMQTLQQESTENGVVWLTIISSKPGSQGYVSPEQANELTTSRGAAPTAVLLDPDGTVGRAYGAQVTPHMYVIDEDGTLVYMGGIDDKPTSNPADIPGATPYVVNPLAALSAGNPIEPNNPRPSGCTVMY
ncbi:MAG: redoxin domain-containing protein [Gammaproteobacteria bacterium]|nr:redoxin domain-containing protein [Gammaproteobacteria bacterium]